MTEGQNDQELIPTMRVEIQTGPDGKPYVASIEDLGLQPPLVDLDEIAGVTDGGEDK